LTKSIAFKKVVPVPDIEPRIPMNTDKNPPLIPASTEVSLVRGGLFYRAQHAIGLIRPHRWNLVRRTTILLAVGWLPLFLITAITNPDAMLSLLKDYRVHSRILVAVPVLLIAEVLMDGRFRTVFAHIRTAGLLGASDLSCMDDIVARIVRLRDSFLPESVILLLVIFHTATAYRGLVDAAPWLGRGTGAEFHLTAAGWYGVVVGTSIFQFLLGLGLWRWLLWTFFAFTLSRTNLKLVATHPDQHGGLGFLGLTSAAFAPIAFSATAVIAATWRNEILYHGAHLMNFKLPGIVLVAVIALVALGPLAFFVPRLAALRRKGILEYGILGQFHSAEFHEKWILHRAGHETEFLVAPESSTLADYGQAYQRIEKMNAFLADKGALYTLAGALIIPALPMILAEVPVAVVLGDLLRAMR
jgi:hypothetical protein